MKVLSINGSPRKDGNTSAMLRRVCTPLAEVDSKIDEVHLHGMDLSPCGGCMA